MRTASGKYRLDAAAAKFFGCETIHLIARGTALIGRFGRTGVIRGSLAGNEAQTTWRDFEREGWLILTFGADFKSCICEYGMRDEPSAGRSTMIKISRAARSAVKSRQA